MSVFHLAGRLKRWRQENDIPLKALAMGLGVSEVAVSKWESGQSFPTHTHLERLADHIGVPVCAFFCEREDDCHHFGW